MTTAPAAPTLAAANTPASRPRPGQTFTTVQRVLIGIVTALVIVIAGIGFAGSYTAVTHLAEQKGFGRFAHVFPIGVDAGIGAFLALDLLLTWLRIPFPLLRYGAWALTAATVAFNAAAAWPDPLGVGMHATIPVLFVIAVEAARHAVGRIADITADKHVELPPIKRWLVAPWPTFRLWRRQVLWQIRSYEDAIAWERQAQVFRARLRAQYGRRWRRQAGTEQLLVLRLATRGGLTIAQAVDMPKAEAAALAEAEARRQAEVKRAEAEAETRMIELREAEAARVLRAETEAKLAEIARSQQEAQREAQAREQVLRDQNRTERETEALRFLEQATEHPNPNLNPKQDTVPNRNGLVANPNPKQNPNPKRAAETETPTPNLGGARARKQAEVEAILAVLTEAGDPKAMGLEDVKKRFGLKQGAAWDRLSTARDLWVNAQQQSA